MKTPCGRCASGWEHARSSPFQNRHSGLVAYAAVFPVLACLARGMRVRRPGTSPPLAVRADYSPADLLAQIRRAEDKTA
jgi:hypothetical protein